MQEKEEWQRLGDEHQRMAEELGLTLEVPSSPQDSGVVDLPEEAKALSQDLSSAREAAHQHICLQVCAFSGYKSQTHVCCLFEYACGKEQGCCVLHWLALQLFQARLKDLAAKINMFLEFGMGCLY